MIILLSIGIMLAFIGVFGLSIAIATKCKGLYYYFLPIIISGFFIMVGSSTGKNYNGSLLCIGVGFFIIIGYVLFVAYLIIHNKNRPQNLIQKETLPQLVKKYCEEKDELLEKNKDNDEYLILKEALEKLPSAYNEYVVELLEVKKISPKTDPIIATTLGNSIGGVTGGVIMGLTALEKNSRIEKEMKEFNQKYSLIKSKESKVIFLINTINRIIK